MKPIADLQQFVMSSIAAACNRDVAELVPETTLLEVGMDSTSLVVLVTHIENVCNCELEPMQILSLAQAPTVADLIALVTEIAGQAS